MQIHWQTMRNMLISVIAQDNIFPYFAKYLCNVCYSISTKCYNFSYEIQVIFSHVCNMQQDVRLVVVEQVYSYLSYSSICYTSFSLEQKWLILFKYKNRPYILSCISGKNRHTLLKFWIQLVHTCWNAYIICIQ